MMIYGTSWTCSQCAVRYRVGKPHHACAVNRCGTPKCGVTFFTGDINKSRAGWSVTMTIARHPLPEPGQPREKL